MMVCGLSWTGPIVYVVYLGVTVDHTCRALGVVLCVFKKGKGGVIGNE